MAGWAQSFWDILRGKGRLEPLLQEQTADKDRPVFTFRFDDVIRVELQEIHRKRRLPRPGDGASAQPAEHNVPPPPKADAPPVKEIKDLIGLGLSGGGIRSAAVCLGVVQGLDSLPQFVYSPSDGPIEDQVKRANKPRKADDTKPSVFDRFDYLSTVSGGGYFGCSLAAAMTLKLQNEPFPFRSSFQIADPGSAIETSEPLALRHLRDNSNYLFNKPRAVIGSVVIYLRGLVVNLFLTLPVLLAFAAVVIAYSLLVDIQQALDVFRPGFWPAALWFPTWPPAGLLAAFLAVGLLCWGWRRSNRREPNEIGSRAMDRFGWALIITSAVGLVAFSANVAELAARSRALGWDLAVFTTALAPFATLFAFLAPRLVVLVEKLAGKPGNAALLARFAGIAVLWLGAAILPVLLWLVAVLFVVAALPPVCPAWNCPSILTQSGWAAAYIAIAALVWRFGKVFADNANSLHRLYRDRLSAAFLVGVTGGKLKQVDSFRLTDWPGPDPLAPPRPPRGLAEDTSPYLLVNAAVNIHASELNKRGRNADFFLFSRNYVGSTATGYLRTEVMMEKDPALDLGTAMAASGAAFSANMGVNSLAPLTPTLALLNARLGYWLPNPRRQVPLAPVHNPPATSKLSRWLSENGYFIAEVFGLLNETGRKVYVTDGGHIDNLGLFELLRRRCKLIVVVDAESDQRYGFSSLVALQKHARIDLGVLIELPWEAIARVSKGCEAGEAAASGPHAAVGRIRYPAGSDPAEGIIVYIKSSITGDENDLIRGYKSRHPSFPHETTIDQLFSEEQFEVYRALGFHMANRLFSGKDRLFVASAGEGEGHEKEGREVPGIAADDQLLEQVVEMLRLPVVRSSSRAGQSNIA